MKTISRNSSRSWFPIIIFLARSGHIEPNAMLVRRRRGGTMESSADGADGATGGGCCRTSTVDRCLCMEQKARGDLNGLPRAAYLTVDRSGVLWTALEQTLGTSGGPLSSEIGWFSFRSSSEICLLPVADQFSAFVSDPSSPLNSTVEEEEKDDGMPPFRTVTTHILDSSVVALPISTLLGPDAQWTTKDIGQSPQHPLGCRAPRSPTERAITT